MRYLNALGLASILAIALWVALAGGVASATTFCTSTSAPCELPYQKGTNLGAMQVRPLKAEKTNGELFLECSEGELEGSISNPGSSTETVSVSISSWTFDECPVTVTKLGEFEVHNIEGTANGTVTGKSTELTFHWIAETSCTYGMPGTGVDMGTLVGGEVPILTMNVQLAKTAGPVSCPGALRWTTRVSIEGPHTLYVEGSTAVTHPVLCKTTTTPCESSYNAGTEIDASASGSIILEFPSGKVITCSGGTFRGELGSPVGESVSAWGPIKAVTWSGCTAPVSTLESGEFVIDRIAGTDNGTLTASVLELEIEVSGLPCIYGGIPVDLGTVEGGEGPDLQFNPILPRVSGSKLCPSQIQWTGEYPLTTPSPLYVEV